MKSLGFMGTGNMATAIIKGITKANINVDIFGYDIDEARVNSLNNVKFLQADKLASQCDYIVLAVKPQSFTDVLTSMKPAFNSNAVVISIAAGISASKISELLCTNAKVVRVMPNTPLMLGEGATAMSRTDNVSDDEFQFVQQIFSCAGVCQTISADKMNEIIAINGSSPAFIYEFARCFIEYGKSVELDEKVCLELFAQTLIGSAKMLTDSGNTIEELITMVSSKGGTTIAGLNSFKNDNLEAVVGNACKACVARAYELERNS